MDSLRFRQEADEQMDCSRLANVLTTQVGNIKSDTRFEAPDTQQPHSDGLEVVDLRPGTMSSCVSLQKIIQNKPVLPQLTPE